MKTDIEIAQEAKLLPVEEIAVKLNIAEADLNKFGDTVAKVKNYQKNQIKAKTNKVIIKKNNI